MSVYVVLLSLSIVKLSEITSYKVPAAPALSGQPKLLPPAKEKITIELSQILKHKKGPSR